MLLRRKLEHCAGGVYAVGLVRYFLTVQGATVYTGACDGVCKATSGGPGDAFA